MAIDNGSIKLIYFSIYEEQQQRQQKKNCIYGICFDGALEYHIKWTGYEISKVFIFFFKNKNI